MEKSSWIQIIRRLPEWGLLVFLILTVTFYGVVSRDGRFSLPSLLSALRSLHNGDVAPAEAASERG